MSEKDKREAQERSRCQKGHVRGKPPLPCREPAKEEVDGLLLCEGHALEAKLEGQIECWGEMLFHMDLWSGEAIRQDRTQIVELLDVERAQARGAIERAYEDLDTLRRSETPCGEVSSGRGEISRRGSLLLLPPKAARPLSVGLRRPRRR
jgi:hypothetical protein